MDAAPANSRQKRPNVSSDNTSKRKKRVKVTETPTTVDDNEPSVQQEHNVTKPPDDVAASSDNPVTSASTLFDFDSLPSPLTPSSPAAAAPSTTTDDTNGSANQQKDTSSSTVVDASAERSSDSTEVGYSVKGSRIKFNVPRLDALPRMPERGLRKHSVREIDNLPFCFVRV